MHLPVSYIHPYYCFRLSADSLYGNTCDYDTTTVPIITPPTVILQYEFPGYFQPKVQDMNINIYHAISKLNVSDSNSSQEQIVEQNFGNGYAAHYQLFTADHPINSSCPSSLVHLSLTRLATKSLTQYFLCYVDFIDI